MVEKAHFSHVALCDSAATFFLDMSAAIVSHTLSNKLLELSFGVGDGLVKANFLVAPETHDSHFVLGKGAGLVSTDFVGAAHSFTCVQSAHQIVFLEHLADRVS